MSVEAWANNFQEEFVKWSTYHTECEMYDGGYQKDFFEFEVGAMDF